jgi:hypothetical protein
MAHHNLSHIDFDSVEYCVPLYMGFEIHLYDVHMVQWHMAGIPEYKYKNQCQDIAHTFSYMSDNVTLKAN